MINKIRWPRGGNAAFSCTRFQLWSVKYRHEWFQAKCSPAGKEFYRFSTKVALNGESYEENISCVNMAWLGANIFLLGNCSQNCSLQSQLCFGLFALIIYQWILRIHRALPSFTYHVALRKITNCPSLLRPSLPKMKIITTSHNEDHSWA